MVDHVPLIFKLFGGILYGVTHFETLAKIIVLIVHPFVSALWLIGYKHAKKCQKYIYINTNSQTCIRI